MAIFALAMLGGANCDNIEGYLSDNIPFGSDVGGSGGVRLKLTTHLEFV